MKSCSRQHRESSYILEHRCSLSISPCEFQRQCAGSLRDRQKPHETYNRCTRTHTREWRNFVITPKHSVSVKITRGIWRIRDRVSNAIRNAIVTRFLSPFFKQLLADTRLPLYNRRKSLAARIRCALRDGNAASF